MSPLHHRKSLHLFAVGELNGKGSYSYKNGDRYEGEFKKGDRDGHGIYIKKSGERLEGIWKAGQIT